MTKKVGAIVLIIMTIMAIITTISHADFLDSIANTHLVITHNYVFKNGEEITICWSKGSKTYDENTYYAGTIKSWGDMTWYMLPDQWLSILRRNDENYRQYEHEVISWEW